MPVKRLASFVFVCILFLRVSAAESSAYQRLHPTFLNLGDRTLVASAVVTDAPWNADPTGRKDATAAIQQALDSVSKQGGGVVFLPAGRYLIEGEIKVGYAAALYGAGGDPERTPAIRRTTLIAAVAPGEEPLLDVTAGEGAVVGLSIWYPWQNAADPVAYPFTIEASEATLRDISLLNAYNGVELKAANTCFVDHLTGTVLHRGVVAQHSTEFSWMRNIRFDNRYWQQADLEFSRGAMTPEDKKKLNLFTHRYLIGLELGRIDGMAIDSFHAEDAAVPVRVEKDSNENQNRVFGFGGVVQDFPEKREDFEWDPWYYGMHYADVDQVPSASKMVFKPPNIPKPLRTDAASFFNVTSSPYLAAGNGSEDDTSAIQQALNSAGNSGGGTVYLPPGKYRITRPLIVPRGVELRGPLGRGKSRSYWPSCVLLACFGANAPHPGSAPALLTLENHAGVRGFEIAYPDQPFDAAHLQTYPYTIRGDGTGIWIADILLINSYSGIDLASFRCNLHVVRDVWGSVMRNGIQIGGGSYGGKLDRIAFSYGPWMESWLVTPSERQAVTMEGVVNYFREHSVEYRFGNCNHEEAWGLAGFDPRTHIQFVQENGAGCSNVKIWLSLLDVANRNLIDLEAGNHISFIGLWGTGGAGGGDTNWIRASAKFHGPLDIYSQTIQPTFLKHPVLFRQEQVRIHEEVSLTTCRHASADSSFPHHRPDLAVDGDPYTYWKAKSGCWLQVDMGRIELVNRFDIQSAGFMKKRLLNAQQAVLYLSSDGLHFQKAGVLETNGEAWGSRPFEPTSARYARLVVTRPGKDRIIRIASFQVFGCRQSHVFRNLCDYP